MLLGPTSWKDYSIPHLKEKFKKTSDKSLLPKLEAAHNLSPKMLQIIKGYNAKTAYKRIGH